ncbi:MAG: HAMP domain-containing histidine kinase [Lachnospiraceae bacterium]|nr:HAMP domain-containing histidine kinase [Lachnospiraceae bacterium]
MKQNFKKLYAAAVIGFAAIIFSTGILMYFEWRSYEEKMEILYVTLEQQGEGKAAIDIVSGLLKGQAGTDVIDAKQRLEQYGFHKNFENRYKKSLYDSWIVTIVVFCLWYVTVIMLIYQIDKRRNSQRKHELLWLQEQITALRDSAAESFQGNSRNSQVLFDDKQETVDEYDEDLGRFVMAFSSLADSLSLFRQQARTEREGTKVLVTDISHQLKTPVAALKTSFEILQTGSLSEAEYQEFLERCSIQIRRLEELVAALVNISRMETGLIELKKEKKNLFETLLLAVNRIYPKAEEREIEIEMEADEPLQQIQVIHDQKWLCEAFLNVLENAVKYSANQTKITIRMIKMTVYLRIEIEDEGIGVPRKEWNKIFQRFYRGEANEVQKESGSGVGLYLAREITSRHEGTLTVSTPHNKDRGSRFVFQLLQFSLAEP